MDKTFDPRRELAPLPTIEVGPLRRWWQKSTWEWISLSQIVIALWNIGNFIHRHLWVVVAVWSAALVLWVWSFFKHRRRAINRYLRAKNLENEINELHARNKEREARMRPLRVITKGGIPRVILN